MHSAPKYAFIEGEVGDKQPPFIGQIFQNNLSQLPAT